MNFSPSLREVKGQQFPVFNRYWNDPQYRAQLDAEAQHARQLMKDEWTARLIESGNRWPAHWTDDEKEQSNKGILK